MIANSDQLQDADAVNETCRVAAPILVQVYQIIAIIVGIVGNAFVIYASKQYSTFNLDSNTIFLVRHLGYVDIAILVLGFLPANFMFVGDLETEDNKNSFTVICTVQGICMNVFGLTALSITALISVHRLLRCTLPQAVARVRRSMMLCVVTVCYITAISVAGLVMVLPIGLSYRYDNGYYSCIGHFQGSDNTGHSMQVAKVARAVGMVLGALFFIIIILINLLLHHFSRKKLATLSGNSLKKHKTSRYRTLTTHSISALLITTWLPFATTFFIVISSEVDSPTRIECQDNQALRHTATFAINFYLLNFVLNPLLYSVTNINFMKFVIKLIKKTCSDSGCMSKICAKLNPDLDISTNVSTMDAVAGGSSNTCPITPERVYSNMLTVPNQSNSTKKKLKSKKSDSKKRAAYKKKMKGKSKSSEVGKKDMKEVPAGQSKVVVITVSDEVNNSNGSDEIVQISPNIQQCRKKNSKK